MNEEPELDLLLAGTVFFDLVFTGFPQQPRPGTEVWTEGMGSSPGGIANLAVAAARLKRTGRKVRVTLPGGDLTIEWRDSDNHVLMTGPVAFEFEGRFDPALFASVA